MVINQGGVDVVLVSQVEQWQKARLEVVVEVLSQTEIAMVGVSQGKVVVVVMRQSVAVVVLFFYFFGSEPG